ncbi:MAG: TolC family outer membrane protein [Gammaproteobacteria bacterium]|nr:TolC family outer membrane protein [Gammaproteobacteria bacterium]
MKITRLAATLFIVFSGLTVNSFGAEDLMSAYRLAVDNDPLLKEAAANRLALLEARPQARAGLLPFINLQGQYQDVGNDGTFSNFSPSLGTTVSTDSNSDSRSLGYQVQVLQPLFRWDRFVALKRADKTIAQAEVNFAAAEQDLASRVAQRYFTVLSARDSLRAETLNKEAIGRQLEQNETRFDVGLIAITDVLESRAAYDQSIASEIEAKRVLATARESLREITGSYLENLAAPGLELELGNPVPADQDAWVRQALEQNLSLEASRLSVEIANDDVKTQRTGHYPSVDLALSHGEFDSSGDSVNTVMGVSTPGSNDQDSSSDTISLQFNVPIYSGGAVSSRVRQAVYEKRAAQQRLERVARETERQTRDAYLSVLSEISRVRALKEAVKSSETALAATEAGFDVGTRTSVDVLNSRRDLLRSQVTFYNARYDYIINLIRLKQAAGSLAIEDLAEINSWLINNSGN